MSELQLARNRVEGGFFLPSDRKRAPFEWLPPDGTAFQFVGTYADSGAPMRDALIRMVRDAEKRVFIASFVIGDDALIGELVSAAERLRGGVYVITALDERVLARGLSEEEKGSAPEERRKDFVRLTSRGVYVRGHESCHAKFAVVDDVVALVGSANFVTRGSEVTGEADVLIRDRAQVAQVTRLFTELWCEGCTWEVPPGPAYVVAKRTASEPPVRPDSPNREPGSVVWTNGPEQAHLLAAIQDTIRSAEHRLTLSTYSIVGMTDHPEFLLDPLEQALNRGVRARMLIRQQNGRPDQRRELAVLHDMGVAVHGDSRNHAKVVLADGKRGVLFSANFDAQHGLDSGVEVGVLLPNEKVCQDVERYIEHAVAHAETGFARNPTLAELDGHLVAHWCKKCQLPAVLSVQASQQEWEDLASATSSGAVLYEQRDEHSWHLYAGERVIELEPSEGGFGAKVEPASASAADRLEGWCRRPARDTLARGFCSSTFVRRDS